MPWTFFQFCENVRGHLSWKPLRNCSWHYQHKQRLFFSWRSHCSDTSLNIHVRFLPFLKFQYLSLNPFERWKNVSFRSDASVIAEIKSLFVCCNEVRKVGRALTCFQAIGSALVRARVHVTLHTHTHTHTHTHWLGTCRIRLSEGISKYQQLKKKSAATALNIVFASAHIQMT
jgi:hypothetical protein